MPIPNDLRQMNRRQVLLASLKAGPTTRSALSRVTGISQPTTGKIVEELIDDGVLRTASSTQPALAGPGRPGMFVKVDDVQPRYLAVQLGIAHTRLAPLTVAPVLRDVWSKTLPTPHTLHEWIDAVAAAAKPMMRQRPTCLLLSVPGILEESTGRTLLSPNARWMEGETVAAMLGEALDLPAHPVQEIQCLALGHRAADPTVDNFLLVDFGIGVGSAAVVRGQLYRGPHPFAGELGHTPIAGNPILCGCGGVGCLETLVGRKALQGIAFESSSADDRAKAQKVLEAAGSVVAAAMNTLGLDHAVITGSVAELPPEYFATFRSSVTAAAVASRFGVVRVDAAPRHRLAGLSSVGIDRFIAPV